MPSYKCYCKKPRRQFTFFTETIEEAITQAANQWEVPETAIIAARIDVQAEIELQKQKTNEGGRVVRKQIG